MRREDLERRRFLGTMAAASLSSLAARGVAAQQPAPKPAGGPPVRFAVIGLNHGHINGMTDAIMRGGGELVALYAKEPALVAVPGEVPAGQARA